MSGNEQGGGDRTPSEGEPPVDPLDLERLLAVLISHRVEFIVVGGMAVAAHGHVRGTKAIDICPDPDEANLRRLAAALDELGAELHGLDEFEGEFELRPDEGLSLGGNWVLRTRHGRLDLMQDPSGIENGYADLDRGAEERTMFGMRIRFCGYQDLIAMKRAAGRDQDLIDVRNLQAARREL